MHLDYRFYVKFRSSELLKSFLERIKIKADDGEVYTLLEISEVFNTPEGLMRMMEPIGMAFDTVNASIEESFCFIHDNRKQYDFFKMLNQALATDILAHAEDDAVFISDLTDFDTDMAGDHIVYYLGGGSEGLKGCIVPDSEGLEHHEIEVSNFKEMLKYEKLSEEQRKKLLDLTGGSYPKNLMDPMKLFANIGMQDCLDEEDEDDEAELLRLAREWGLDISDVQGLIEKN